MSGLSTKSALDIQTKKHFVRVCIVLDVYCSRDVCNILHFITLRGREHSCMQRNIALFTIYTDTYLTEKDIHIEYDPWSPDKTQTLPPGHVFV